MVVARHIKDPLTIHSKAEMTNAVMSLLDQVAKLSERNSQLSEQSSQLAEQNSKLSAENSQVTEQNSQLSEQLSLVTEQNARLQEENTALVQRVSDLERSVGLNSGNSSKPPSSDGLKKPSAKENRRTRSQRDTVEKHARMTHEEANWRLSLTQPSGYSNSFSSGNEGKATRDDPHRKDWDGSSLRAGPAAPPHLSPLLEVSHSWTRKVGHC